MGIRMLQAWLIWLAIGFGAFVLVALARMTDRLNRIARLLEDGKDR